MRHTYDEKPLPQCPFWREIRQTSQRIGCEGLTDHCQIILAFDSPYKRDQHEEIFCCEHYRRCEIYRAVIEAKYAEEVGL